MLGNADDADFYDFHGCDDVGGWRLDVRGWGTLMTRIFMIFTDVMMLEVGSWRLNVIPT